MLMTPHRRKRADAWVAIEAARIESVVKSQIAVYVNAEIEAIARMFDAERPGMAEKIRARKS